MARAPGRKQPRTRARSEPEPKPRPKAKTRSRARAPEQSAAEFVSSLEQQGYTRAKIGGFDVDGILRGKYVSLDKLRSALKKGFGFCDVIFGWDIVDVLYDNVQITGPHSGYPDVLAVLDPATLAEDSVGARRRGVALRFSRRRRRPAPGVPALAAQAHDRARRRPGLRGEFRRRVRVLLFPRDPRLAGKQGLSRAASRSIPACSATAGCAPGRTPS